jgi:hypothetical protein
MGGVMLVRVPDRETGGWEFDGEEVARVSTRYGAEGEGSREARPRWGENAVWKLDGDRGYAVLRASFSVIYHTNPTRCRNAGSEGPGSGPQSGLPAKVTDLPEDAEPCPRCEPPPIADLLVNDKIRFEFPRQSVDVCEDPAAVIRCLTHHRRHTGERQVTISEPVRALIVQLREADPAFATAHLPMQRIG